jgi:hypothetical protein
MVKEFRSFESARKFVQSLGLKNNKEWVAYCKSGNKPDDIPSDPEITYDNNGWKTMKNWLNITIRKKSLLPFEEAVVEARKLAKIHNITGIETWRLACEGALIVNLPSTPYKTYRKDWKGIGYWLGTGKSQTPPPLRYHRPFKEARDFVRALKLKNNKEWVAYCKSGNKPDDIPSTPSSVYTEWKNIREKPA